MIIRSDGDALATETPSVQGIVAPVEEDQRRPSSKLETIVVELPLEDKTDISGHYEKLDRNFGIWSICASAITCGNSWLALAGGIAVAVFNGGPAGVIYEFIAAEIGFWLVAASIAELVSSLPSSGGVYHWAAVTAGPHGRICGWLAGWWNMLANIVGTAALIQIAAYMIVSMYAVYHPDYSPERWHIWVTYVLISWVCCLPVLFANKALPRIQQISGILLVVGLVITVGVCAAADKHATSHAVWSQWSNATGYRSDGFAFLLGMLNGVFSAGPPDTVCHLAEEVLNPRVTLPKTILVQFAISFTFGFVFLVAIFYGISDLDKVLQSGIFPLAEIYYQCTHSRAAVLALLILAVIPLIGANIGCLMLASRAIWTLSRDNAMPFSKQFGRISEKYRNPFNAILLSLVLCNLYGLLYLASSAAFGAFLSSWVLLISLSYLITILPHLLSRRRRLRPAWFWMKGATGYVVNILSCLFLAIFGVIFCFPLSMPVDKENMNYTSLITGGLSILVVAFYFYRGEDYLGPRTINVRN